jgi:hypothetical protein
VIVGDAERKQTMFSILKILLVLFAVSGAATAGHVFFNASSSPSANWKGGGAHGAPGPIVGAGLPLIAAGYGVYWLVKRRRKAD